MYYGSWATTLKPKLKYEILKNHSHGVQQWFQEAFPNSITHDLHGDWMARNDRSPLCQMPSILGNVTWQCRVKSFPVRLQVGQKLSTAMRNCTAKCTTAKHCEMKHVTVHHVQQLLKYYSMEFWQANSLHLHPCSISLNTWGSLAWWVSTNSFCGQRNLVDAQEGNSPTYRRQRSGALPVALLKVFPLLVHVHAMGTRLRVQVTKSNPSSIESSAAKDLLVISCALWKRKGRP